MSATVVGLGPMGQALAGALLDAGVDGAAGHGGDEITRMAQPRLGRSG